MKYFLAICFVAFTSVASAGDYFNQVRDLFNSGAMPVHADLNGRAFSGRCFDQGDQIFGAVFYTEKFTESSAGPLFPITERYIAIFNTNQLPQYYDQGSLQRYKSQASISTEDWQIFETEGSLKFGNYFRMRVNSPYLVIRTEENYGITYCYFFNELK